MTNPSVDKGNRAERDCARWLADFRGYRVERIRSGRSTDAGDLTWPGSPWTLDVKHQERWRLGEWFAELELEARAENTLPLLVLRRAGIVDPGRWLAVVRLEDLELDR